MARTEFSVEIVDPRTGSELCDIEDALRPLSAVFSSDDRRVITLSLDGTRHLHYWRPPDLIREACTIVGRDLSSDEWNAVLPNEPRPKTCAENRKR
jgi:hypothetical protein